MTIDELVAALEKAEGPSRELDAEIAKAVGWECRPCGSGDGLAWRRPGGQGWYKDGETPPFFTASVVAALTLVPDGARWEVLRDGDGSFWAWVSTPMFRGRLPVMGATPAIALCIAALKARRV